MARQIGGGMGGAQPSLWEEDKPCYCKTGNAAVVALCLQEKSSVSASMPLEERIHRLHRLHMKLDAVVVAHKANKFSGTSDSYLVVLPCDSELEAEEKTQMLGDKLLDAVRNDAVARAVGGFGEVGFGVIGSTGWNYQFYGDLIASMRNEARECIPGHFHYRTPTHIRGKHLPSPSSKSMEGCNQEKLDEVDEVVLPTYSEWRARNLQHSELWVLMITLLLSILAILGAVEKTQNNKEVHVLSFVLQLQCFFVNLVAIGIWFVNRKFFVAHHQQVMMCVWICQLLNRFIGMVAMPIEPKGLFRLYPFRVIAANGPEKLLLTSVPMVNTACSLFLHLCGMLSAIFFSLCSCSDYRSGEFGEDGASIPFECQEYGRMYMVAANLLFSLGIPVLYAAYSDFKAQREYLAFKNPKSRKQL
ncbi:hypothetical protein BSKO_04056 [Bryopsis sp. KO-2023]|nr:hypothetical protein BSKO_04056 [Bryopsis sp. KO-2023]